MRLKYDKRVLIFCLIKLVGVSRLFVLVYTNEDDEAKRFNAQKYYLWKGVIKNYNAIINGKNFYDQARFWYKLIWRNEKVNDMTRWRL